MTKTAWNLLQPLAILLLIYLAGMIGYIIIEDFSFVEAFYMTTISVTTAGFTEVRPLSTSGRIFGVRVFARFTEVKADLNISILVRAEAL